MVLFLFSHFSEPINYCGFFKNTFSKILIILYSCISVKSLKIVIRNQISVTLLSVVKAVLWDLKCGSYVDYILGYPCVLANEVWQAICLANEILVLLLLPKVLFIDIFANLLEGSFTKY